MSFNWVSYNLSNTAVKKVYYTVRRVEGGCASKMADSWLPVMSRHALPGAVARSRDWRELDVFVRTSWWRLHAAKKRKTLFVQKYDNFHDFTQSDLMAMWTNTNGLLNVLSCAVHSIFTTHPEFQAKSGSSRHFARSLQHFWTASGPIVPICYKWSAFGKKNEAKRVALQRETNSFGYGTVQVQYCKSSSVSPCLCGRWPKQQMLEPVGSLGYLFCSSLLDPHFSQHCKVIQLNKKWSIIQHFTAVVTCWGPCCPATLAPNVANT